ncbi:hypothetical protein LB553_09880 [Mesorhizobium sp. CA8]|uniref:hypothetical protein n=1 Tax=unclassified Mesorhizobium TaxID=325217 RepID=UPI001CCFDB23|nr:MULTISPECIES: hypothetical protein [unclassified Mesorhizobium]MBZ9761184.1 hypothetical protein [Mesorhizobium sp. CA8]MBZ9819370.1 hypothetical protein [Mesorhizobium sp. CA4]
MTTRKIDKGRGEQTSAAARQLLETERLERQAKTARLREQRLAATTATTAAKSAPGAAKPKSAPKKKRKIVDIS